jgi:hypothetical protein
MANQWESVIERLLTTIEEQGHQILKLSELIANKESMAQNPMQFAPPSYKTNEWDESNDEFNELREQREAQAAKYATVEELEAKLADEGFLNTEISFDE